MPPKDTNTLIYNRCQKLYKPPSATYAYRESLIKSIHGCEIVLKNHPRPK